MWNVLTETGVRARAGSRLGLLGMELDFIESTHNQQIAGRAVDPLCGACSFSSVLWGCILDAYGCMDGACNW